MMYYLADVHRYDSQWVSARRTPPALSGWLWRLATFPGDEQSARGAMLISWLLLGAGILLGPTRPTARTPEKAAFYRESIPTA
jgi:hypothetical protein